MTLCENHRKKADPSNDRRNTTNTLQAPIGEPQEILMVLQVPPS